MQPSFLRWVCFFLLLFLVKKIFRIIQHAKRSMLPSFQKEFGNTLLVHSSQRKVYNDVEKPFGVEELDLPVFNPDLNLIQHPWEELKQRL